MTSSTLRHTVWILRGNPVTAIAAAGAFSVRILPALGFAFMAIGALAFLVGPEWSHWLLGLAFGGVHIACGVTIARRYGG